MRFAAVFVLAALASAPAARADVMDKLRINGYGSLEFEKELDGEAKSRGDKNGSFDADGFDLVLNFTPSERFRVSADLTWEHGAATEEFRGNVAVEYAFAEFYVQDWLKARAGKQFVPFGIYNEIHTAKPLFLSVKEPYSTGKIDKLGSTIRFYPRWGAGLSVLGQGQVGGRDWDYVVQLANGDQSVAIATDPSYPNPYDKDDNTPKALAARVRFHPAKSVTVGASLYSDHLEEFDSKGVDTGKRTDLFSYGAQATWDGAKAGVEFEYVSGSYESSAGIRVSRYGLQVIGWANLGRFRPYLRYESHDPDRDISDDEASTFLGGLNVRIVHGLYIKADVNWYESGAKNKRFKGLDYTELKAAVAFGF
jgi:hypothetical protein